MKKYIKAKDNENIPIILQGSSIKEVVLNGGDWLQLNSDTQFNIFKIINPQGNYSHRYSSRLREFYFGQGILWDTNYERIVAIFLEGQKVVVLNNWSCNYTTEFTRFKKALKEAGYNTRKCISIVNNFDDFFIDPLAPKFEDYSEEQQKSISREFLLIAKEAISISEEDDMPW